jgi:hypothetical protein
MNIVVLIAVSILCGGFIGIATTILANWIRKNRNKGIYKRKDED